MKTNYPLYFNYTVHYKPLKYCKTYLKSVVQYPLICCIQSLYTFMHAVYKSFLPLLILLGLTVGCASVNHSNPKDPFESYNRAMFKVNDAVDFMAIQPIARGYSKVVPNPVKNCVGNIFDNLKVPFSALNNVLQGKLHAACEDVARFTLNTTAGVAGCIDIASKIGLPNHKEDLGQTLAVWGVPSGPYIVLPVLGPSNVRDGLATLGQMAINNPVDRNVITQDIHHIPTRNTVLGLKLIQTRAELLPASDALKKMGVDEYTFIKDASFNRRNNQVYDGNPPDDLSMDEPIDNTVTSEKENDYLDKTMKNRENK